jgi:hypothetical protein
VDNFRFMIFDFRFGKTGRIDRMTADEMKIRTKALAVRAEQQKGPCLD